MCGRYKKPSDKQRIAEAFAVDAGLEELDLGSEDEAAPGSMQPVLHLNANGERQLETMRWGFKLPDRHLFVARSEGVDRAGFWRERFRTRCIVPAASFFDWAQAKTGTGRKPKYEFSVAGRELFGMAGLWAPWTNPKTGKWELTFAILTVEANEVMRAVKDRQPAILEPRDYTEYLESRERPPVHLLRVLGNDELKLRLVDQDPDLSRKPNLFDSLR